MSATGAPLHVEIVQVLSNTHLMDAENNECKYFREDRRPLARGHYVVVWPGEVEQPRFDQRACFYGPYGAALIAKLKAAEHVAGSHQIKES